MLDTALSAEQAAISRKPSNQAGVPIKPKRYFTADHPNTSPYDLVEWELRDVEIKDFNSGKVIFSQKGIETPRFWTQNAITIVAQKYFRGHGAERENSVKQLIDRVAKGIAEAGVKNRYFDAESAQVLEDELRHLCLHQMMAFNSPVWFNVGTVEDPQCSACFILDVQDNMESILAWPEEEGYVFRKGSGAGVNISHMREKNARITGGGFASGPLSFALGADRQASAIKSGGKTRRAAKMLVMNVDHPDIEEFVQTKVEGERVAQALIAAGFDPGFNVEGGAYDLAPWQNANNSVRATDEFMRAVSENGSFSLISRAPEGGVTKVVKAKDLFRQIAEAAWRCGDPGMQFHDTVNRWHTCPADGEIEASNPCSEYMFLNNTACNLASLNLMKFYSQDAGFDVEGFRAAVEYTILAQEIIVSLSSYPTKKITEEAKKYRTLGIGYANLGAMLMTMGLAYDSDEGRDLAGAITSLMSAVGYRVSGQVAKEVGTFTGFFRNQEGVVRVLQQHQEAHGQLSTQVSLKTKKLDGLLQAAEDEWAEAIDFAKTTGLRNAQVSVLAPTGTISFMMDCDTTGVEPDLALVKYKKLVGGGTIKIVNQSVRPALMALGYDTHEVEEIVAFIEENDTIEGAPHLKAKDLKVFDCSLKPANGERSISPQGHINMMAACQPFLSGAISKTVNLPREATVEDIESIYMDAWKKGLKAIALYRDGCKESQPLNVKADTKVEAKVDAVPSAAAKPQRERLPDDRMGGIHKFSIAGHEGYLTLGYYPDGRLGEVFINMSKQGSTLGGLMDAWATMMSMGLQYGIPLDHFVEKFKHTSFEPSGFTTNPDVRMTSSLLDYVVRVLEQRARVATEGGLMTVPVPREDEDKLDVKSTFVKAESLVTGPPCTACGAMTVRAGACYKCDNCGSTTGCG